MRKSGRVNVIVDIRIVRGNHELSDVCHLLAGNVGLEIASGDADCTGEAAEWFERLFGLLRSIYLGTSR